MKSSQFAQGIQPQQPTGPERYNQSWIDCNGRWAVGEHPLRDFFKPKVFVKNLVTGIVITAGWRILKGSW